MNEEEELLGPTECSLGDNELKILHSLAATNNLKELSITLDTFEKRFKSEEFHQILFSKDNEGHTSVYKAAEHASVAFFESLWVFIAKNLNKDDQRRLLLSKDQFERNVLMAAYHNRDDSMPKVVFETFKRTLSGGELMEALIDKDFVGDSILSVAFKTGSVDTITECLTQLDANISSDEMKNLVLAISPSLQQNILHRLLWNENEAAVLVAWNFITRTLAVDEIKSLLMFKDADGDNMFIRASFKDSPFLKSCLKWFSENSKHDELVSVMNSQDRYERTLMHYLGVFSSPQPAQMFFDFASETFSKSELSVLFLKEDDKGENPLKWSLYNENELTACVFWKAYESTFDSDEFEKLVFKNGTSCLKFKRGMNQSAVSKITSLAVDKFGRSKVPENSELESITE